MASAFSFLSTIIIHASFIYYNNNKDRNFFDSAQTPKMTDIERDTSFFVFFFKRKYFEEIL